MSRASRESGARHVRSYDLTLYAKAEGRLVADIEFDSVRLSRARLGPGRGGAKCGVRRGRHRASSELRPFCSPSFRLAFRRRRTRWTWRSPTFTWASGTGHAPVCTRDRGAREPTHLSIGLSRGDLADREGFLRLSQIARWL